MYRKNRLRMLFSVAVFALFIGFAAQQQAGAAMHAVDLNPKLASGQFIQKVDAFDVIIDTTLSMNDIYKTGSKLKQQRDLVVLFNNTIPNLKLTAAVRAFGQFAIFRDSTSKSLFGPAPYSKSVLPQAIAPFTTGMGFSPMNAALEGAMADLRNQTGNMAVIVFSDGEDMAQYDPVAAARQLKKTYGERICIYAVHIGESAGGRKLMHQVADAGQCGYLVTGDSIAKPAGMAAFVERVFLEAKSAESAKQPVVQEIKTVRETAPGKVSIALHVEFDTNKANIKPKYNQEIKKVADYMTQYPATTAVIEGHTDNVGNEAANVKLSQRRAESIKAYLVEKFGINGSRIKAVGYGPSKPIASNATDAGRQKNRRVDAVFSDGAR